MRDAHQGQGGEVMSHTVADIISGALVVAFYAFLVWMESRD